MDPKCSSLEAIIVGGGGRGGGEETKVWGAGFRRIVQMQKYLLE